MYGSPLYFPGSTEDVSFYLDSNNDNIAVTVTDYDKSSYIKNRLTN